jgi:cell division protease FtsH
MAEHERRPKVPTRTPDNVPEGSSPRTGMRMPRPRFIVIVLALLAINYVSVALLGPGRARSIDVAYNPTFLQQVKDGNVKRISSKGATVEGEFKQAVKPPDDPKGKAAKNFTTEVPTFANTDQLSKLLEDNGVIVQAKPINSGGLLVNLLLGFGPVLLLVGLFVFLARRAGGAGGGLGALGAFSRSRARRVEKGEQRITFKDVAGIDEAKAELTEIVDFLKNPGRYQALGGRIPRGVLLSGQPGTGKTLLAKAVAGEAEVPFFSISASEFVEAIVGIGASRVRDLFKTAKESSPAIIFIDELDAIGRSRSSGVGFGGGNDEREQTLNQILTEMDGFESDVAVIVLGATNRPEILDQALLRPGRFDRRVVVPPPDKEGRRKILEVHTRSLPLADDVNLDRLASTTPGMVGADLANLANEAALTAARREHQKVAFADFTDALEKIVLGAPRGTVLSDQDRKRVAYHEAGHAIVGMLTPDADPVRKVSIIPRGMALGVTLSAPELDKANYEENYLLTKIKVALGGRVAEELVYGTITTGAESDIEQLTGIARAMVGRWGMSQAIGPISVMPSESRGPLLPGSSEVSPDTQRLIDQEVQRIVDESHEAVTALLTEHRANLESLVAGLLEQETLDQDAAYAAAQVDPSAVLHSSGEPTVVASSQPTERPR